MAGTSNKRADGTLRPKRRRYRQKKIGYWRHRTMFESGTDPDNRIWNGEELQRRLGGITYAEAGARLENLAEAVGWIVFRDGRGKVHAIGKPMR